MPRFRVRALAVLLAGLAAGAFPVRAQDANGPRTHTVRKGDTLWDLARQYFGDSYLWPEIYRVNTDLIEDPHWIYPGEVLRLPDGQAFAHTAPAETAQEPRRHGGMTIFNPEANRVKRPTRESLILGARSTAVRAGEFTASPFMWAEGGLKDGGKIETSAEGNGIHLTAAQRPIQYREVVFVALPKGARGTVGEQFLVYRLSTIVEGQGRVVVPTGIVRLVTRADQGRAQAELTQKYEDVFVNQGVTALDTLHMPTNVFPARVAFGLATRVTWLYSRPVLPTTGEYLILAAGGKDGLVSGDQVTLRRARGVDDKGTPLPDESIGIAQITRVTPWGASAIILEHHAVGIAEGMHAQVTAKMP